MIQHQVAIAAWLGTPITQLDFEETTRRVNGIGISTVVLVRRVTGEFVVGGAGRSHAEAYESARHLLGMSPRD